ncbi:YkgJ family cysteine cluster protein [Treponema sp.]|uniref:YkgJ family cysteine cluster protein n=1 Tax=Treponema sp. TaxID=166 RepID=UPI0025FDACBD|nr:YkgJ family cysteine cluster protein [Treponema sp.]MCR5218464.1 YkgJ family cysteine cluster protein [Treponema sp.]
MEKPFYQEGLHFECKRCSFCCGHSPGYVYLSKRDLLTLCKYFDCNIEDFVKKYCRWAGYYEGKTVLALFEKKNYDCILWNNGCTAYPARPVQCSTYPFWTWMIEDQDTWNECAKDCPGMNSGKLWPKEKILADSTAYQNNTPITREEVLQLMEEEKGKYVESRHAHA